MLRLTRKAFLNLAIWMIGFGVLIGLVFPPFATLFGVPAQKAYSVIFIASCLTAGVLVGLVNFGLTKLTVGRPLWRLVKGMRNVQERLLEHHDGPPICTMATCAVPVESEDALGEGARSFNRMLDVLSASMHSELALRSFSEVLARHLDTNTLTTKALELLLEHSDAQGGAILVERQGNLEICASHGLTSETSLSDNEHVQRAFAKGIGQRIEIPETVKVEALLSIFRPREILVEPIVQGAATLGVLVLAKGNPFEEDAKGRLELMRRALALALNNALMVERLQ
ncbi:MAG: GGDEF domain-containing protein, partial [Deltaproteobacteria bacterium]|nr:GGDEF domain-containing protein [Deltaproteobacteria bacterium]